MNKRYLSTFKVGCFIWSTDIVFDAPVMEITVKRNGSANGVCYNYNWCARRYIIIYFPERIKNGTSKTARLIYKWCAPSAVWQTVLCVLESRPEHPKDVVQAISFINQVDYPSAKQLLFTYCESTAVSKYKREWGDIRLERQAEWEELFRHYCGEVG